MSFRPIALLSLLALAAPTAADDSAAPLTLHYQFQDGAAARYRLRINVDGYITTDGKRFTRLNQSLTSLLTQTPDSLQPDGSATLTTTTESIKVTQDGEDQALPDAVQAQMEKATTLVLSATGRAVSRSAPTAQGAVLTGLDLSKGPFQIDGPLPEKPVPVGGTWTAPIRTAVFGLPAPCDSTLTKVETADGAAVATITQKVHGAYAASLKEDAPYTTRLTGSVTSEGETRLRVDTGAVQSQTAKGSFLLTLKPQPGSQALPADTPREIKMQVFFNGRLERLPDGASASGEAADPAPAANPTPPGATR